MFIFLFLFLFLFIMKTINYLFNQLSSNDFMGFLIIDEDVYNLNFYKINYIKETNVIVLNLYDDINHSTNHEKIILYNDFKIIFLFRKSNCFNYNNNKINKDNENNNKYKLKLINKYNFNKEIFNKFSIPKIMINNENKNKLIIKEQKKEYKLEKMLEYNYKNNNYIYEDEYKNFDDDLFLNLSKNLLDKKYNNKNNKKIIENKKIKNAINRCLYKIKKMKETCLQNKSHEYNLFKKIKNLKIKIEKLKYFR